MNYETIKKNFFENQKKLSLLVDKEINENRNLKAFLQTLNKTMLYTYIFKDYYLKQYIFSASEQKTEMLKAHNIANTIIKNKKLLDDYINNHDNITKEYYTKISNDYSDIFKKIVNKK